MSRPVITPTGKEVTWDENDIIVSKTDTKGIITYANRIFQQVACYSERELVGQPHNIVRHPDMPRCVFKLLWDTISNGTEIFAYVVNLNKHGDHYWVLAHVTPSFDMEGNIVGYHSNRRVPRRDAVDKCVDLYKALCAEEAKHTSPKDGIHAGENMVLSLLEENGITYDKFALSL